MPPCVCGGPSLDMPLVALDFETADFLPDSACALGMTRIENGRVTDEWYRLVRPPRARVHFTDIHGLTWEMLKNERSFAELWPEISGFLGGAACLAAHNAAFDRRVLYGCCQAFGLHVPSMPFVCTLRGARLGLDLRHNGLGDVCRHLDINLNHHHAGSDARACALIYLHLRALGLSMTDMLLT